MNSIIPNTTFNIIQNTSLYTTDKCHYLLIHKNACTTIRGHLDSNSPYLDLKMSLIPDNSNLPYWTVTRDPYDRFISGLTYDIFKSYPLAKDLKKVLGTINFNNLFLQKLPISSISKSIGKLNHTVLQWTYLFNQKLDFYVDIKDLDLFLEVHFEKKTKERGKSQDPKQKEIVKNYIESNPNLKSLVFNYLSNDYYLLNQINNSGLLWNWQMGKMF